MPGFPFPAVGPLDLGSPPYRSENSDHRYYGQLRLPNVHLRLVRCSLSSPDTLYCSSLFVVPCGLSEKLELSFSEPGVLPKGRLPPQPCCTRKHPDLPSSQTTPLTTCPARRPRWCPDRSPYRNQYCCLPLYTKRRLSLPVSRKPS